MDCDRAILQCGVPGRIKPPVVVFRVAHQPLCLQGCKASWGTKLPSTAAGKLACVVTTSSPALSPLHLQIFPSVENVRCSLEGYMGTWRTPGGNGEEGLLCRRMPHSFVAGGSIPYDRKVAEKQPYLTGYLWWVPCCKAVVVIKDAWTAASGRRGTVGGAGLHPTSRHMAGSHLTAPSWHGF